MKAIREKGKTDDSRDDTESMSKSQLPKIGVKYDAAKHEHQPKSIGRFISQHRTETVSRWVLTNILTMILECLCACSTCTYADLSTN